jgi:predicted Zn-dependent peptidase
MSTIRRAARTLRATLEPRAAGAAQAVASATALTVMVESEGRAELVSMRMRGGALSVMCTCGNAGCAHALEALALFASRTSSSLR